MLFHNLYNLKSADIRWLVSYGKFEDRLYVSDNFGDKSTFYDYYAVALQP